jgi:hypothetical protein
MPATKHGEVLTPLWELLFSFDSMFTSLYFDCFRDTGTPKPSLQIFLLFCLDHRWKSYCCSVMTPACLNCMSTAFCLYVSSLPLHRRPASTPPAYPKCHHHCLPYPPHHHLRHCHHPSPIPVVPLYFAVYVIQLLFILKSFSVFLLPSVHLKYVIFYVLLTQFMDSLSFCYFCPCVHFFPME